MVLVFSGEAMRTFLTNVFDRLHRWKWSALIDEVGLNRHRIIGIINKFEVRSAETTAASSPVLWDGS